jgi:hypothetical protein
MRHSAMLALAAWCVSGCHPAPGTIDPVALCDSLHVDTTWQSVAVGGGLTVLIPWSLQHAQAGVEGPPPYDTWYSRDLSVQWNLPFPPSDPRLADSLDALRSRTDPSSASPACSAPAPDGWVTRTYIRKHGKTRIIAVYSIPPAPRHEAYALYIAASSDAAFRDGLAVAKSLRVAHSP